MKRHLTLIGILLIVVLGSVVYSKALDVGFLWDDHILIKDNLYVKNPSYAARLFTSDYGAGSGARFNYFRPLQTLSYALEYRLWGAHPRGYHAVNIILHLLVGLTLWRLILLIFQDKLLGFLSGLFFVVHPVQTETVVYLSNRGDLLAVLCMLLCALFYIRYTDKPATSSFLLMLLTYLFALFAKENSLMLPLLLSVWHFVFRRKIRPLAFLSLIGLICFYLFFRIIAAPSSIVPIAVLIRFYERIPSFLAAVARYIGLLFLPLGLHADYGKPVFHWFDPSVLLGLGSALVLLAYAFKERSSRPLVSFSILWFFTGLLPFSHIYPLPSYLAEHYLYAASIGFVLLLAYLLTRLYRSAQGKTAALICIIGLAGLYSCMTVGQTAVWQDPVGFYRHSLEYEPENSRLYHNLGDAYNVKADYQQAIAAYRKAIQLEPGHADTYTNLGLVYSILGKSDNAIALYKEALARDSGYVDACNNLGAAYYHLGRKEEAISWYKKAIALNPLYTKAYVNLGLVYTSLGRPEQAIDYYKRALKIDPAYAQAYNDLGAAYMYLGRFDEALDLYKKAVRINPGYADAYYNMGLVYSGLGDADQALAMFKKTIAIEPRHADAYYNLGVIYKNRGDTDKAIAMFEEVMRIEPQADASENLKALKASP